MRVRAYVLAAILLASLAASVASAAADCDASSSSQADLTDCYGNAYKKADAELNGLYRKVTTQLKDDKPTAKLLVTAQKAWVAYRDAECTFATSSSAGGTIYPMLQAICLDQLTRKRIDNFKAYLKCDAGDGGCAASVH